MKRILGALEGVAYALVLLFVAVVIVTVCVDLAPTKDAAGIVWALLCAAFVIGILTVGRR